MGYKERINMTRKDFENTAKIIKYLTDRDCESLTANNLVLRFLELYMSENPRFDSYKFIKACGFRYGGKGEGQFVKIQ
jgi:hypothetical protein